MKAIEKGRFDAAYFILPFVLLNEYKRSPLLSVNLRMNYLSTAFIILRNHYKQITTSNKGDLFQQKFYKSCIGVVFSEEIYLKRIINTVVGFGVALSLNVKNLVKQNVSSHNAELFFGKMRFFSFNDNSYSNAVKVAVDSIKI